MSKQKFLSKTYLKIHVGIKCSKTQIKKYRDELLDIQLKAIPEKGEANDELIRFLANWLGIPKNQIFVFKGKTSRNKLIELHLSEDEDARLRRLLCSLN